MKKACFLLLLVLFSACKKENIVPDPPQPEPTRYGQVVLKLNHVWGEGLQAFYMYQWMVHPETADSIRFDTLQYYVSGVSLKKQGGDWVNLPMEHYLVSLSFSSLSLVALNEVPVGTYEAVRFQLGVDSVSNRAGIGTGFLSLVHGMYHGEAMGYVHVKAIGATPTAPVGKFHYELCGFRAPHQIHQYFEPNELLEVAETGEPALGFYVNTAAFWDLTTRPQQFYVVHTPGAANATLTQNFARAFVFEHVH
jgi:hypothetical protein